MVILLGTQFVYTVVIGIIWLLNALLILLTDKFPCIEKYRRKTTMKVINRFFLTRFFMEIHMNLVLFSIVNVDNLEWDTSLSAVNFSNLYAVLALILAFTCPIYLVWQTLKSYK